MKPQSHSPLHVLVVDDSAVVRTALQALLSRDPGITVAVASDPIIAMTKIKASRPDVIVLDLQMPRMDGLTFLARLMADEPIPVVVCSNQAGPSTEAALRALTLGAVDLVAKPQIGLRAFLEHSAQQLVETVRGAALARVVPRFVPPVPPSRAVASPASHQRPSDHIVAIGASTGGTEALRQVLSAMPAHGPAMIIVQHMPAGFTTAFANRLSETCAIEVKEAVDGDPVRPGRALVAPGNHHVQLVRDGQRYVLRVTDGAPVNRHRPSVDVLFRSVAAVAARAVGVIMTGMGDDGADGLLAMRNAGAYTLAQDEASCVVFGMPREAIARNAVDRVISLTNLPAAILHAVSSERKLSGSLRAPTSG
jgi:two-component system chemotaxis response regulator CheB